MLFAIDRPARMPHSCVVAEWRTGNVVARINEVTQRQARLVPGW